MSAKPQPYDHDHENEVTLFAETNFRGQRRAFGIKTDDRRRHMYVVGKTGMGKTTLLENMVLADIVAGHGVAYIDPHGDTAQNLLDFIPPHRINDVVYFNPSDVDFPIGFNILETTDPSKKHLVAAGLMAVFKKMWPDVWSARMEYMLLNTVLALLDVPGSTLLGIMRLLADADYRKRVTSLIQDPVVKTFWVKEFASFTEKYRIEAVAPLQNKVGQFLSANIVRNIVAQVKSTIDVRDIMDNRKIFIVNLSKGLLGEENARLLGGMIVTRLQLAAMERVDIVEKDRQDFYLYIDEFQNFATDSFKTILSEARKYRLSLTVAHQYIEQLDETVASAIFGNVGTIITFRVGAPDSLVLENEFAPQFTAEDLVNLGKYDIYLKLMIDGAASQPFSAATLPPIATRTGSNDKVLKVSRERYARPRVEVEDKVLRWSGMGSVDEGMVFDLDDDGEPVSEKLKTLEDSSPKISAPPPSADKPQKPTWEIPCSVCGKVQKLTFEPDRSRPWFCKEDLEKRQKDMEAKRASAPAPIKVLPRPKREEKPRPSAAEIRAAEPVVKAPPPEASVSLSALLGKPLSDSDEPEVIIEPDGPEDGETAEVHPKKEPSAEPPGPARSHPGSDKPGLRPSIQPKRQDEARKSDGRHADRKRGSGERERPPRRDAGRGPSGAPGKPSAAMPSVPAAKPNRPRIVYSDPEEISLTGEPRPMSRAKDVVPPPARPMPTPPKEDEDEKRRGTLKPGDVIRF